MGGRRTPDEHMSWNVAVTWIELVKPIPFVMVGFATCTDPGGGELGEELGGLDPGGGGLGKNLGGGLGAELGGFAEVGGRGEGGGGLGVGGGGLDRGMQKVNRNVESIHLFNLVQA